MIRISCELSNEDVMALFRNSLVSSIHPIVEAIIDSGIDVNYQDETRMTLLEYALIHSAEEDKVFCEKVVDLLIKAGADVNLKTYGGYTPLYLATHSPSITKMLIKAGADVNLECLGETILNDRLEFINKVVFDMLIKAGADVNVKTNDGRTPLLIAVEDVSYYSIKPEIVKGLIDAGANLNVKNRYGKTAWDIAKEKGNDVIMKLIEQKKLSNIESNSTMSERKIRDLNAKLEGNSHLDVGEPP